MTGLTRQQLYDGSNTPPAEQIALRAGPISARYEDGTLRYVKLGRVEIVRQVYSAVRDHNWGTIPGTLSNVRMDIQPASFAIRYRSQHQRNDINFVWDAVITGNEDGTIVFKIDGEARSTFKRNRIGFCVLHPMDCAGLPCSVEHVDGEITHGHFPGAISPHQPFFDIRAITHEVIPGVQVRVLMQGDTFEMEDQRNWTDASYKTYCTPLGLPFPVTVQSGTKISQTITIQLQGDIPDLTVDDDSISISLGEEIGPLPQIGLCIAGHGRLLSVREIARLSALNLNHLRVDVRLWLDNVAETLKQATAQGQALGASLEVAIHMSDQAAVELTRLRQVLEDIEPPIARWLVFREGERSTTAQWVELARKYLGDYGDSIPIGAGTDAFFTELNRERPPVDALDLVTYSTNPQVHAFDNPSLTETLTTQATTVESARQFSGTKPIVVSPVTLKIRWNPNATGPVPDTPPGELPAQVDPRQMSLFGAAWTLGSIKYLAKGGAHSITYFETTGWLGIMESNGGSPLPDKFPSLPGNVYPMYHVFANVGEFAEGQVLRCQSTDILRVDALALRHGDKVRVMLANFTATEQTVTLHGFEGPWNWRSLDAETAIQAIESPRKYREQNPQPLQQRNITLQPHAIVRLDRSEV